MSSHWTSFWQFQTLRSCFNIGFLALFCLFFGLKLSFLLPKNIAAVSFRTLLLILCTFCLFCASPSLTFTQMATGLYTYPIFVVVLAISILGEKLNHLKVLALFLGILGGSLVLKPWDSEFSSLQLLPLLAGLFFACNLIVLRKFCQHESPFALNAAVAVGFLFSGVVGGLLVDSLNLAKSWFSAMPFIAIGWLPLTLTVVTISILAAFFNLLGNLCLVRAYQTAESSWLAPLDFLYLAFALFWGKVMFKTFPDVSALFGMLLILFSGIVVTLQAIRSNKNKQASS